jgi:hypothetical protein
MEIKEFILVNPVELLKAIIKLEFYTNPYIHPNALNNKLISVCVSIQQATHQEDTDFLGYQRLKELTEEEKIKYISDTKVEANEWCHSLVQKAHMELMKEYADTGKF